MVQKDRWATRIVESARDAILIMDAGGLVLQANDAADTLLGLTRAELVGSRLPDLMTPGAPGEAGRRRATITSGAARGPFEVELTEIECTGHPALHAAFLREVAPGPEHGRLGLDGRSLDGTCSDEFYPVLGAGNGGGPLGSDGIRGLIHPAEGQAVRELLAILKRQPGRTAQAGIETATKLLRPDGTMREIRLRGRVDRDETGELSFAVGVVQDVSGARNSDRLRDARRSLNRALDEWQSLEDGVVVLLHRFASALDLPVGSLWTWSEAAERLECTATWSASDLDPAQFAAAARGMTLPPGSGAISLAWESGRPVIAPELTAGLAFPAVGADGTIAVAAFSGAEPLETSERLLSTLESMGHELGHFLELQRGQVERRALTARELEILRHAADGERGPEIARRLVISPSTVKTHFENIYDKLGVSDRAAAVAQALRAGLIA
jgi:DNA-binding CsgD family transcriptional regulator/PAS domain-containing protein